MTSPWTPPGHGWIEHTGGPCPVPPETEIQWITERECGAEQWEDMRSIAGDLSGWAAESPYARIVAYRLADDAGHVALIEHADGSAMI